VVLAALVDGTRPRHLRLNDDIDELSQRRADVEVEMDGLMSGSCMPEVVAERIFNFVTRENPLSRWALRALSSSDSFSKSEEPASSGIINLIHLVLLVFCYWIRKKRFLITVRVGRIRRNPRILYENLALDGFLHNGVRALCCVELGWLSHVMCELSNRGFLFSDWRLVVVQDFWASDFEKVVQGLRGKERIGYHQIGSFVVWRNRKNQIRSVVDTIIDGMLFSSRFRILLMNQIYTPLGAVRPNCNMLFGADGS